MSKKIMTQNILLLVVVAIMVIAPLMFVKDSEFGGADGAAGDVILELNESYVPWAEPIISPPGGETESLLFALQAALGAGVICFGLGYLKGKSAVKKNDLH